MTTMIYRTLKGSEMEKMFDTAFDKISIKYYIAVDLKDSDVYDKNKKYNFQISIRHNEEIKPKKVFDEEYDKLFLSINSIDDNQGAQSLR